MTITIGFWFWPVALVIFGAVAFVVSDRHDGGGIASGCLGALICMTCWAAAAGLAIGRYFA